MAHVTLKKELNTFTIDFKKPTAPILFSQPLKQNVIAGIIIILKIVKKNYKSSKIALKIRN